MRRSLVYLASSIVLAACALIPNQGGVVATQSISVATQPACQPSETQPSKNGFPEIQGTMKSDGEMWALLFFDRAQAKEEEKIVWRITGTGRQFDAQAQHEDGTIIHPIWGPAYHGGSDWERPGEEWGTGFNFPEPGCWTITVRRGAVIGEIRLEVSASQ